ncbi:hypothetical protein KDK77_04310 [bacterium]|nr:hypothetical protein [bacterium]MCP5463180.1 hypothetical protein [bacterium]
MEKQPVLRYCFVCENVIKDEQSGSLSFISLKNFYTTESLPASWGKLFVVFGFKLPPMKTNGSYTVNCELKIIDPNNKIVLDMHQRVCIKNQETKLPTLDIVFGLERFTAKTPGIYRIQLLDLPNELFLGETEIEVRYPPPPNIQYKTEEEIEALLAQNDIIKQIESSVRCPLCKHEKKFKLRLEKDLFKRMEQEMNFPDDLIYICENCQKWSVHLGRILKFMHKKLGQPIPPPQ